MALLDTAAHGRKEKGGEVGMSHEIENVLAALDDFRMSDQMDYAAYSQLHDLISELDVAEPSARKWISVRDRLPDSGQCVLATCEIHSLYGHKKLYVCEAYYAKEHSISEGRYPEDTDCYDYSEEDDEYYLKEGWYEVIHNWDEYGSVVIGDFVTHWRPLPEPPKEETQ